MQNQYARAHDLGSVDLHFGHFANVPGNARMVLLGEVNEKTAYEQIMLHIDNLEIVYDDTLYLVLVY